MLLWQLRLVRCVMRKYFKFLVLGALSSCAFVTMALHAGAGLYYYCQEECLRGVLKAPLKSLDWEVVLHIRNHWVDPPAPRGTYMPAFPLDNPPWVNVGYWNEGHHFINAYFEQYKKPGTFMEIGAKDGEFMSLTLFLEQKLGFSGLLVEPNPADYLKLRAAGRSSYSINACATPKGGHRKDVLFLKEVSKDLPEMVRRVEEGNNVLLQYVKPEAYDSGQKVEVQCFSVGAMAMAALRTINVDLLVISTHAGNLDIFTFLPIGIKFRMIVVLTPLTTKEDWRVYKAFANKRDLKPIFDKYNFHILIPKRDKVFQALQSRSN